MSKLPPWQEEVSLLHPGQAWAEPPPQRCSDHGGNPDLLCYLGGLPSCSLYKICTWAALRLCLAMWAWSRAAGWARQCPCAVSKWLLPALQRIWAFCTSVIANELNNVGMKPLSFPDRYSEFAVAVLSGCWDTPSSQNTISFSKSQVDILLLFASGETRRVLVLCKHKGPMKLGDCKRREVLAKRNAIHICNPNIFLLCVSQPDSRLCSVGCTHPGCWLS